MPDNMNEAMAKKSQDDQRTLSDVELDQVVGGKARQGTRDTPPEEEEILHP